MGNTPNLDICYLHKKSRARRPCPIYNPVPIDLKKPIMLNTEKIKELMKNPDALDAPWYGQLMRGPQVLAYIVQMYYWIKDNDVKFV